MSRFEFDCFVCDERLATHDIEQLLAFMAGHKTCGAESTTRPTPTQGDPMSTDAPRPERVTLSAEEREALICDCADSPPSACVVHGVGHSLALHCPDDLVARVERILAAREQALREDK